MERIAVPAGPRAAIRRPKRLLALRSDERLVEHVRSGDAAAFEVLYERHVAGVLGFCRHMLRSQHEAEDAVQQAFVSAHRDMLRGEREINFKPWLYTIARNRCLSMLRARREQAVEAPELSTTGLAEGVEQRSELRELVADVQRLPEDQREALVLSELGDLSHVEIAHIVGVEPMAVKGLVFRARSALIERRDARTADCGDIREELAVATGGGLRRSRLRYHLESCPGCVAYLEEVRRQRKLLGVALPVVPTLALHENVMAAVGIGTTGAGAAGGLAAGGLASGGLGSGAVATTAPLIGGTLAKVAVVGAIALGGAGVATEVAREDSADKRSGSTSEQAPASSESGGSSSEPGTNGVRRSLERNKGRRGAERREIGQRKAEERSGGKSAAGEQRGKGGERAGSKVGLKGEKPDPGVGRRQAEIPRAVPPTPKGTAPVSPVRPKPVKPPKPQGGSGQPPSPPAVTPPTDPTLPPHAGRGTAPID